METSSASGFSSFFKCIYIAFTILFTFVYEMFLPESLTDGKRISKQRALLELRALRDDGVRDSERVVDLWNMSLSYHIDNLGYEKYSILEQVFIAALDVGDKDLANSCLDKLLAKFRHSSRINRLFGMYLESKSGFEDAQNVYAKLINEDPTNTFARKRLVAILKAQQKPTEAINELRQYLGIFMSDFEAWSELADLYLTEGDYKHAAFCMEEMLLSNPSNHLYCQRYAEIKYTEGGIENLELARVYFAQACQLCPNNLRSLYGLLLTCCTLDNQQGKLLGLLSLNMTESCNTNHDAAVLTNGPNSTKSHYSPSSGMSSNVQRNSNHYKQSNCLSLPDSEKNKRLAKWAAEQIRLIYTSVDPSKNDTSINTAKCMEKVAAKSCAQCEEVN